MHKLVFSTQNNLKVVLGKNVIFHEIQVMLIKTLHVNQNYRDCEYLAKRIKMTCLVWTGMHKLVFCIQNTRKVMSCPKM